VAQLLNALIASGGADLDYAALGTVLFGMAGADGRSVVHEAAKGAKT
jgi:hypothetical protein